MDKAGRSAEPPLTMAPPSRSDDDEAADGASGHLGGVMMPRPKKAGSVPTTENSDDDSQGPDAGADDYGADDYGADDYGAGDDGADDDDSGAGAGAGAGDGGEGGEGGEGASRRADGARQAVRQAVAATNSWLSSRSAKTGRASVDDVGGNEAGRASDERKNAPQDSTFKENSDRASADPDGVGTDSANRVGGDLDSRDRFGRATSAFRPLRDRFAASSDASATSGTPGTPGVPSTSGEPSVTPWSAPRGGFKRSGSTGRAASAGGFSGAGELSADSMPADSISSPLTASRRSAAARRGRRQAHLTVARVEPGSVMKFSFVVSLVAFLMLFVAVAVLYGALSTLGVFESVQHLVSSVTSGQSSSGTNISEWFSASKILGYTAMLGLINIFLITAMCTIGAVIYNLISHVFGGIEITLREGD